MGVYAMGVASLIFLPVRHASVGALVHHMNQNQLVKLRVVIRQFATDQAINFSRCLGSPLHFKYYVSMRQASFLVFDDAGDVNEISTKVCGQEMQNFHELRVEHTANQVRTVHGSLSWEKPRDDLRPMRVGSQRDQEIWSAPPTGQF